MEEKARADPVDASPRGGSRGVSREELSELVERGLSTRAIGESLELSQTAVRHWLRVHGLRTRHAVRRGDLKDAAALDVGEPEVACPRHGITRHVRVNGRGLRCAACRSEAVAARRRKIKTILVAEAGGRCKLCGYDVFAGALHFHHVDPAGKSFHLSQQGAARSLDAARVEAAKCVLLCSNCHAEVEGGVRVLPS